MFKGSITALVSPFKGNNLDLEALKSSLIFRLRMELMALCPVEQQVSRRQ